MNSNTKISNKVKINNKKNSDNLKFYFPLAGLIITVLFILFVRIRLLNIPLERDEGEYAYMAQLILKGFPPYSIAYNFKFPGIYYMYAMIIGIFGQTPKAIHLGLMVINISIIILIYFIIKKLINSLSAFIASSTFAILSLSSSLLGQAAHATHFVTFFGIVGIYFLIKNLELKKWYFLILTGICMGLSVLMKQSFAFPLFAFVLVLFKDFNKIKNTIANISYFLAGFILPVMLIFMIFILYGNFNKFWFWTIDYVREYGSIEPFSKIPKNLSDVIPVITKDFAIFWILFIIGIPFIFINKNVNNIKWALFLFIFLSIISVFPGYYFRPHYFIPLLPAFGIVIAVLFNYLYDGLLKSIKYIKLIGVSLYVIILFICINNQKDYFFNLAPKKLIKMIYFESDFDESVLISDYIKSHTGKNDKILVLGSEPQIYFYSDRISVTPYIYMFDLMYDNSYSIIMQKELINDFEREKPKIVIYVNHNLSWQSNSKSNNFIFTKSFEILKKDNYKLAGIVNNVGTFDSYYLWGNEVMKNAMPKANDNFIFIYTL